MNVFILEHITAGGMGGEPVPIALADAGLHMWRAAVEDFSALGCKVYTTAGERTPFDGDPTCVEVNPTVPYAETVEQLVRSSEAALIIAPETGGILQSYEEALRLWGVRSLGCEPRGIALCADKFLLGDHWYKAGFSSPMTGTGPTPALLASVAERMKQNLTTWIIKPRDGAGCERTYLAHTLKDLERLDAKLTPDRQWVAQNYFPGLPASVSFIVHNGTPRPLLAGRQLIQETTEELKYKGGRLPLDPALAKRAIPLATEALAQIPGLQGFVGVDLVLGAEPKVDVVIEVNPRLTVSYCGLRKLCKTNLAAALLAPDAPIEWNTGSASFDHAGRATKDGWS